MTPTDWLRLGCVCVAVLSSATAPSPAMAQDPTPEEYVAFVGNGATIVPSGELLIAGRRMTCGRRPTVLDPDLDDYGAAYPGFVILNPNKLAALDPQVAMWIFSHECGHQFRGPDEETADCFAAQRGRRQGWLKVEDVEKICNFIAPASGDAMHFSGPQRCNSIRKCYGEQTPR